MQVQIEIRRELMQAKIEIEIQIEIRRKVIQAQIEIQIQGKVMQQASIEIQIQIQIEIQMQVQIEIEIKIQIQEKIQVEAVRVRLQQEGVVKEYRMVSEFREAMGCWLIEQMGSGELGREFSEPSDALLV